MKELPTQQELKELFDYDPKTGIVTRKVRRGNRTKVGEVVGSKDGAGYLNVWFNGHHYQLQRIIWCMVHGYFPEHGIDHENRVKYDNKLSNLRELTQSCNMHNTKIRINNVSGVTGVCFDNTRKKWLVQLKRESCKFLYRCEDFKEAVCIRLALEQCLELSKVNSESSAFEFVKNNIQG